MARKDGEGKPSHPFISYGTGSEDSRGVLAPKHIERRVEAIFSNALRETEKNRLSVGSEGYSGSDYETPIIDLFVQFHNFRAWYGFSRKNFTSQKPSIPTPVSEMGVGWNSAYTHTTLNHGAEHFFDRVFDTCSVTLKRRFALVRNHFYGKRWARVRARSVADAMEQVQALHDELVQGAERALRAILSIHGGASSFVLDRPPEAEIKIRGDEFVNQIPAGMVIHAEPVFKKVYKLPNIEFLGTQYVKNFIEARAIDRVAPDIAAALASLAREVRLSSREERLRDPIKWIFDNGFHKELNEMSSQNRTSWLMEVFG